VTRSDLVTALAHPNVAAFLEVIAEGESGHGDDAYTEVFGGGHFDAPPWAHPAQPVTVGRITSTAAGKYQFLSRTWQALVAQYGFEDFSPPNQDLGAIALIAGRKALDLVKGGQIREAIARCSQEWASLPGSPYGQPTQTLERALAVYQQYGGTLAAAPSADSPLPAAKEVKPMGILAALLPSIIQMLPQLIPVLSTGHDSEEAKTWQGAGMVVANTLQQATNTNNLVQAVAAMQQDPAALAAASAAINEILPQLTEGGGGGIAGARTFAADHENGRYGRILEVVSYSALFFLLLANVLGFTVGWFKNDWTQMAAIIQADIGVALMVFGFFVGSSLSSKRKDEARGVQ
jgi:muramidase (phage lysozyme)